MDIDQTKKLSQDKIESDFLTRIVRRNIKRKGRERQDAREGFRQAFEVLIESQDKSAASQNAMLDELRDISEKLDYDMPRRRRRRRYEYESSSESSDKRSEASEGDDEEDYPRPHMRIPGLITQGIADLTRRGAVGAADLARRGVAVVPDLTLEGARRLYNMLPQIRNRQQQPQQLQQQLRNERQKTQLMEAQAQAQKAKNISEQIKQERQRQQSILDESQRLIQTSNKPSLVSEVGDAASSLASALGSAASSAASSLLLNPTKGTDSFIKESLTPTVRSSNVFPVSQQISSSDIFPHSIRSRRMSSSIFPQTSTYS